MPSSKPMRLVRKPAEPTRQQKAEEEIRERQKQAPFGMGTVDARPADNYLDVDAVLEKSFRQIG